MAWKMDDDVPELFRNRMERMIGKSQWGAFFDVYAQPLNKSLRVNINLIARENFVRLAVKRGWQLAPIPWEENGFFIDRDDVSVPLGKTLEHFLGLFYIQEASSMAPVRGLNVEAASVVLDMSSAPGSKTTQLSCLMHNTGLIVANDVSAQRTKATVTNIERQACANVGITTIDALRFGSLTPNTFDRVLLDAPCSGEGTYTKTDDFFKRWNIHVIRKMSGWQKQLIVAGFEALKAGGTLVYSTCTFAPEENEAVVEHVLETFPGNAVVESLSHYWGWTDGVTEWEGKTFSPELMNTRRIWPHLSGTGGFFIAKISKCDATSTREDSSRRFRSKEVFLSNADEQRLCIFLEETYGIPSYAWNGGIFTKIDHAIWHKPTAYAPLHSRIPFDRCGVKLGEEHDGRFKLSTMAARVFGKHITRGIVFLEPQQIDDVRSGRDVTLSASQCAGIGQEAYIVLEAEDGCVLGTGLLQGDRVKNQIPRAFI